MSDAYTGGCACGAIRYEVSGEPMAQNICQCRQCQRQTGTGHATFLAFSGADVSVQGKAGYWETVGENGTVKQAAFCPTCGSPVYFTLPALPDIFLLLAGNLDDPGRYRPQALQDRPSRSEG